MLYEKFKNGINLGGWLSQYEFIAQQPLNEKNLCEHFDTFIQESDIRQIAVWKFDHVRLPVNGYLLYDSSHDRLNETAMTYIHKCINWCAKYQLNVVIDLHDFYGNIYGAMESTMPLLTEAHLKEQFIRAWCSLAKDLHSVEDTTLMFELLNEVSDASGAYAASDAVGKRYSTVHNSACLWNRLALDCIKEIRKIDSERWILVGSNGQNSVVYLKQLETTSDPFVFYNFHYYEPQVFTHQQAGFSEEMREFDHEVGYPGDISAFVDYLNARPEWKRKHLLVSKETQNDRALMEKLLRHAVDFERQTAKELYCGEFGVIAHAPAAAAKSWVNDLTSIFEQNHIGHALWNYKYLDFGLLNLDGSPCSSLMEKE